MADICIRRENAAWGRAIRIDRAAHINADCPAQRDTASRMFFGAAHARAPITDRFRKQNRHAATRLRVKLAPWKGHAKGDAAGATAATGLASRCHPALLYCQRSAYAGMGSLWSPLRRLKGRLARTGVDRAIHPADPSVCLLEGTGEPF